jgi:hypothetical protein
MRPTIYLSALVAIVGLASVATAQPPAGRPGDREARRERIEERRERFRNMTPEQRDQARARMQERRDDRLAQLGPEMRAWVETRNQQARSIAEQVKSGALTRDAARDQMRTWLQANPRPANPRSSGTP